MLTSCLLLGFIASIHCGLTTIPAQVNDLAESTTQFVLLQKDNCTENSTINLSIKLVEGKELYLNYPSALNNITCPNVTIQLTGQMIGFAVLEISETNGSSVRLSVGVTRPPQQLKDEIFLYGIILVQVINTLGFGISLDLQKVRTYLTRPVAPALGFIGQFILMPLIAFTLTRITTLHPAQEFGVFAAGVSPGGGASNIWCYLLGADIDLSITMTFLTTVAAVVMIPVWMYSLGPVVTADQNITIPFEQMAIALGALCVPLAIGLLINKFLPKAAVIMFKIIRVFMVFSILFAIIMGIYANVYAFEMLFEDYQLALCALSLPYIGGVMGFLLSKICRQDKAVALTIGIETALQNTQLSTVLLRLSLPQPWGDISSAIPVCLNMFTPWPLMIMWISRVLYLRLRKSSKDDTTEMSAVSKASETKDNLQDEKMADDSYGYRQLIATQSASVAL